MRFVILQEKMMSFKKLDSASLDDLGLKLRNSRLKTHHAIRVSRPLSQFDFPKALRDLIDAVTAREFVICICY